MKNLTFGNLIIIMRNLFLFAVYIVAISFISCGKNTLGCMDPFAINYDKEAVESNESCIYHSDKFIGNYSVSDSCDYDSLRYSYNLTISQDQSSKNAIRISNLHNAGQSIVAIAQDSSFSFPTQGDYQTGGGYLYDNNKIVINYFTTDSLNKFCSLYGSK